MEIMIWFYGISFMCRLVLGRGRWRILPTYVIGLIGNQGHEIVGNHGEVVVIDREPEMRLDGRVHDSDSVLFTGLEDGLVAGSAIAISVRAVDESVLKHGRNGSVLHGFP